MLGGRSTAAGETRIVRGGASRRRRARICSNQAAAKTGRSRRQESTPPPTPGPRPPAPSPAPPSPPSWRRRGPSQSPPRADALARRGRPPRAARRRPRRPSPTRLAMRPRRPRLSQAAARPRPRRARPSPSPPRRARPRARRRPAPACRGGSAYGAKKDHRHEDEAAAEKKKHPTPTWHDVRLAQQLPSFVRFAARLDRRRLRGLGAPQRLALRRRGRRAPRLRVGRQDFRRRGLGLGLGDAALGVSRARLRGRRALREFAARRLEAPELSGGHLCGTQQLGRVPKFRRDVQERAKEMHLVPRG